MLTKISIRLYGMSPGFALTIRSTCSSILLAFSSSAIRHQAQRFRAHWARPICPRHRHLCSVDQVSDTIVTCLIFQLSPSDGKPPRHAWSRRAIRHHIFFLRVHHDHLVVIAGYLRYMEPFARQAKNSGRLISPIYNEFDALVTIVRDTK